MNTHPSSRYTSYVFAIVHHQYTVLGIFSVSPNRFLRIWSILFFSFPLLPISSFFFFFFSFNLRRKKMIEICFMSLKFLTLTVELSGLGMMKNEWMKLLIVGWRADLVAFVKINWNNENLICRRNFFWQIYEHFTKGMLKSFWSFEYHFC